MKWAYLIGVTALLALTLVGCKRSAATQAQGPRAEVIPVTVATVTNVAWDRTVTIIGTLYPKDEAMIAAQVDGQVEKTLVEFGDRVRTNQDLAFIDTASYEARLEQAVGNLARAEASLANARQNYERMEKLRKDSIASASDYDQAQAQLAQAEADVKAARGAEGIARLDLQRSRVQAPFDGAISQRVVGRGDYVKISAPLFSIVNDAVLKFIFQVPERYASYVQKKLPVNFSVDNYPGQTFTGSVYLISPAVSLASRSFNVGALVTNADFRLKANTFARGSLVLERGVSTPVVPLEAVTSFAGVTKVFVVEGNRAHSHRIRTGRIRDGFQEILDGVNSGDAVVITGQSRLTDGAAVEIQTARLTGSNGAKLEPARLALAKGHPTNSGNHENH